jgi:hypothetical protein
VQEVFGYRTRPAIKTDLCIYCGIERAESEMVETGPVYLSIELSDGGMVHFDTGNQYHACPKCADDAAAADHADYVNGNWDRRDIEDEFGMGAW